MFQQGSFLQKSPMTPEEIARKRAVADALMGRFGRASNVGEGVGDLLTGVGIGLQGRRLNKAETEGKAGATKVFEALLSAGGGGNVSAPVIDVPGASAPAPQTSGMSGGFDVRKGLIDRGMSPQIADAFVMNFKDESNLNPGINEANPVVPGSRGGFGLSQWTGPRRKALEAYAASRGLPVDDGDMQLDFLMTELQGPESAAWQAIQAAPNTGEAAAAIVNKFLRPAEQHRAAREARYLRSGGGAPDTQVASLDPSAGMPKQKELTTISGRPTYTDPNGGVYSEKTVTFPVNGRWVTFPSVDSQGGIQSEEAVRNYVIQNGPVDPVTGETFPTFATQQEAIDYAKTRSATRLPTASPKMRVAQALQQRNGASMQDLISASQNPWMNGSQRQIINMLLQQQMQASDPMRALEMQKLQQDLVTGAPDYMSPADRARLGLDQQRFGFDQQKFGAENQLARDRLTFDQGNAAQTNDIREYNVYAEQERAAGRQPIGFMEYQQALKKAGAASTNVSIGGQAQTKGRDEADKKYADDYRAWTTGGAADAVKQLEQLKGALGMLQSGENLTGPVVGQLPDWFNAAVNPTAISTRERVEEVVQRNLRTVLGAQFTEKEGERLIKRAFNPALSEQENARRVNALINQVQAAIEAKNSAAEYFSQNGTLTGWNGKLPTMGDFDLSSAAQPSDTPPASFEGDPALWEAMTPEERALWN